MKNDPGEHKADGGDYNENDKAPAAQLIEQTKNGLSPRDYFGFLTGLNPALLDDKWMDKLPNWSAPKRLPVKVTGSRVIAARFR